MNIAAYAPDLMDRSKIAAAIPGCRFVTAPEALVGLAGVDVIVVDLRQPRALEVLPDISAGAARVVAFGSHVDRDRLAAAEAAGAEVLARSQFFAGLPHVLTAER